MRKYDKKKREGQKTKVRYCKICGDMINLATGRTKYCSVECAKIGEKNKRAEFYLRLAEEKAEVEPLNAYVLDEAEREVETYNKTHGTNYSYGWYQHLKKLGHLL